MRACVCPCAEASGGRCAVPPDDPRTPFNETSFFNATLGYQDYVGWSALMGQLSAVYPHLVALQVRACVCQRACRAYAWVGASARASCRALAHKRCVPTAST